MSDNTGTGTGGVSPLYIVQPNITACDLRYPASDFWFYMNQTDLTQCSPVNISWPSTSWTPITFVGVIPGGQAFPLVSTSKRNVTSLVWNTNIVASTQIILGAFTSGPYGNGGSTKLLTIGDSPSRDSSCINELSPSSTLASDGSEATSTGGAVVTVTAMTDGGLEQMTSGLSTGAIVGIVIVSIFIVLSCQVALFWFCCRRQIKEYFSHRKEMKSIKTVNLVRMDELESADLGSMNTVTRDSVAGQTHNHNHLRRRSVNSSSISVNERMGELALDQVTMRDTPVTSRDDRPHDMDRVGYGSTAKIRASVHPTVLAISPFADPPDRDHSQSQIQDTSSVFGRRGSTQSSLPDGDEGAGDYNVQDRSSSNNFEVPTTQTRQGGSNPTHTSSTNRPLLSKSQIADLIASNPDSHINSPTSDTSSPTTHTSTSTRLLNSRRNNDARTRQSRTRILRMHEDAGRIDTPPPAEEDEEEVEELPPVYDDAWSRNRP
nr:hypothetical protein I302_04651 [Kwoniella bestiolae CBS 10118]OCF26960.1 hypothetical protein I302_04651 [Kwoniella bestiolae CBS 10118]